LESTNVKSAERGKSISAVVVLNISPHGFWLLIGERELFVSFTEFPWFREATVASISRLNAAAHLYWPDLDIDRP
jgi:hypothetical protein